MKERAHNGFLISDLFAAGTNLFKRILLIFLFVLILVVGIIYLSLLSVGNLEENMRLVLNTEAVLSKMNNILSLLKDAEAGQRGYIMTQDSAFLQPYIVSEQQLSRELSDLRTLVQDNPTQAQRIQHLDSLVLLERATLHQNLDRGDLSLDILKRGQVLMVDIRNLIAEGQQEEIKLMNERNANLQKSRFQTRVAIIIFSIVALALVIAPLFFTLFELRKRLELQQLLDSVLNTSMSGIQSFTSVRDDDNKIVDFKLIQANNSSYRIIKELPGSLIGKRYRDLFPDSVTLDLFKQYVRVVETGVPLDTEYYQHINGFGKWIHVVAVKLRDGFTLTFEDVTRTKVAELELKKNVDALKRSNAELEQFAYVASHDLQEPLRKIVAFTDRLRIRGANIRAEDSKDYFDRIVNAAQRMRTLISDLLEYSRMNRSRGEIVEVDLNLVLQEVLSDLEVPIQQKKVIIRREKLPVLEGINVQLRQLFQNLLSNSLKFTSNVRNPEISIRYEFVDEISGRAITPSQVNGHSLCRIFVNDNGIGFEHQHSEKIFQIFHRLHGRSEYEGTGMGLAICKKIVENHHGTIIGQGMPERGSTFIVTLPIKQL